MITIDKNLKWCINNYQILLLRIPLYIDEQINKYRSLDNWFYTPQGNHVAMAFGDELQQINEQIKGEIKEAMMAKDTVRLSVVRGLVTAFMNELVATNRTPQDTLSDDEALKVITRTAKQRKDAIAQFEAGGRKDLADEDREQLAVLEKYLPTLMSADEVRPIAIAKKTELGVTDKNGAGKLTGMLMKELAGKADGAVVKQVVDSLFI